MTFASFRELSIDVECQQQEQIIESEEKADGEEAIQEESELYEQSLMLSEDRPSPALLQQLIPPPGNCVSVHL
jgi:hypothetical protein